MNPLQDTPGRSRLLRAGFAGDAVRRPFLRRALIAGAVLAPVVAIGVAIMGRYFAPDGPGRVAYLLHDIVYLPLRGLLWTRIYPFGFAWAVPLAILVIILTVEWLSPASLTRAGHRRIVLAASRRPWGRRLLSGSARVYGRFGAGSGFAAGVTAEALTEERSAVLELLRKKQPVQMARAGELALLWLNLQPTSTTAAAAAAEIAALSLLSDANVKPRAPLDARQPLRKAIAAALKTLHPEMPPLIEISPGPDQRPALRGFASPTESLATVSDQIDVALMARDAALPLVSVALGAGLAAALSGPESGMGFFDRWARMRLTAEAELAATMAQVESMISFPFWAALAERDALARHRDDIVAEVLAPETRLEILGEGFADRGMTR